MKQYTMEQAEKEVGKSKSYKVALKVSIKKWKEILKHGTGFYNIMDNCGYCLVTNNRKIGCRKCPVKKIICRPLVDIDMDRTQMEEVLRKLKARREK